jgi:hypothetical protein
MRGFLLVTIDSLELPNGKKKPISLTLGFYFVYIRVPDFAHFAEQGTFTDVSANSVFCFTNPGLLRPLNMFVQDLVVLDTWSKRVYHKFNKSQRSKGEELSRLERELGEFETVTVFMLTMLLFFGI